MFDSKVFYSCPVCSKRLKTACDRCTAFYKGELADKPKNPQDMTPDEKANEIYSLTRVIFIEFDIVHRRVQSLLDRMVLTQEFIESDRLVEEARTGTIPSLQSIMDIIPKEKRITIIKD